MRDRWDWTEFGRLGEQAPVRREVHPSMYREALRALHQKKEVPVSDPLPEGTYMYDFGEGAIVIVVDAQGHYTLGFDGTCPPTSEWAGTSPEKVVSEDDG